MSVLLDASVLIAIIDEAHTHHHTAMAWFVIAASRDDLLIDTTAILAAVRIVSQKRLRDVASCEGVAQTIIEAVTRAPFRFVPTPAGTWTKLADESNRLSHRELPNTDLYLIVLAKTIGATFVTFDRAIARRFPDADILTLDVP